MKRVFICLIAIILLASLACKTPISYFSAQAAKDDTSTKAPGSDTSATPAPRDNQPEPESTRPPRPEEPEYDTLADDYIPLNERVLGYWYADKAGLLVTLELNEDGFSLSVPGSESLTGDWEAKDGEIVLNGDEENPLLPINDVIFFDTLDLLFTREMPAVYVPAEIITDAREGSFDGFFKAQFVAVSGGTILANVLDEDTIVYIEGTNVALGGTRFGNVIKVFSAATGALTLSEDVLNVKLELQQDSFLRMTLPDTVIYLMPAVLPGTDPAVP